MIGTLLLMDREPGCTCRGVYLNKGERREAALYWERECPVHGVASEWYEKEGRAQIQATNQRAIDLQRQAREARQRERG